MLYYTNQHTSYNCTTTYYLYNLLYIQDNYQYFDSYTLCYIIQINTHHTIVQLLTIYTIYSIYKIIINISTAIHYAILYKSTHIIQLYNYLLSIQSTLYTR